MLRVDGATGRELARYSRDGATHLEPLFVPEPDGATDDAGGLLVPTLGPHDETTVIAVVDPHTMLARAELRAPQVVPFGFHAAFDVE